MGKNTRLCHFVIVDGSEEQIATLAKSLVPIKEKLDFDIEFLVSNDRIRLYDVKYMIDELYKIYKKEEEILKDKEISDPKKQSVSKDIAASPVLDKKDVKK